MAGASGDVLVTIKAKYESVDAALKSLQGIDKAISGINKKKIAIDTSGATRALRTIEDGLEKVSRAASLVGDKALGVRQLRNDLNLLGNQLADAQAKFRGTTDETKRGAAAATILAGRYKQMRLELAAFAKARRDDKQGEDLFGRRAKGGAAYGPFGDIKNQIADLKALPKTLADTTGALGQINFALENATVTSKEFKELAQAQNYFLEQQASIQAAITQTTEKRVVAEQKVTAAVKETVAAKKADPGAGSKAYFPPGVLKIPGAQSMLDKQGAGSLERAIQMAFRAQEAVGGAKYPAARALEDLLGPSGLDKVMTKIRAFGGSLDLATTDVKRFGTSFPGGTLNIPGAEKMLREQGPGSLRSAINLSRSVQAETGMPAAEALRLMLDDMTYFGQKLKELGWSAQKVDDAFVKIGNAATRAGAGAGGAGGGGFNASGMFTPEARSSRRAAALPRARRMAMRRGLGGKTAQNYLLGGGFPMLFGGGAGAVGGSMAGAGLAQFMGMPGAGFGLQIMGSALGTMFEDSIKRVKDLSDAMNSLNMDSLIEQGIRFSSELQTQVELLREQGEIEKARALLEKQFQKQTGGTGQMGTDVANAVNMLSATWNDVRNAVSLTLGTLSVPFMAALALILDTVAMIFKAFNRVLGAAGSLAQAIYNVFPDPVKKAWEGVMDGLNNGLQKANAQADKLSRTLKKEADILRGKLADEQMKIYQPKSISGKLSNLYGSRDEEYEEVFRKSREREKQELGGLSGLTNILKVEEVQDRLKAIEQAQLDIITEKYAKQITALETQRAIQNATHESTMENLRAENELAAEKHRLENPEGLAAMFGQSNAQELKRLEINKKILAIQGKIRTLRIEESINANAIAVEEQKITNLVAERNRLMTDAQVKIQQLYKNIGQTIEDSLVSAIEAVIDKTKSLNDILSQALKQIGMMLIRMGIQSALGGINFGPAPTGPLAPDKLPGGNYIPHSAGGYVDSPQLSMIAEGGQGEYVIPEREMSSALARYSQGARGEAVLAGGAPDESAEGGVATATSPIDVRFTSERINSIDYVTFDQFQAGVAAAAQQGAKQGEMATLKRLRTSPGTRRGLGI